MLSGWVRICFGKSVGGNLLWASQWEGICYGQVSGRGSVMGKSVGGDLLWARLGALLPSIISDLPSHDPNGNVIICKIV